MVDELDRERGLGRQRGACKGSANRLPSAVVKGLRSEIMRVYDERLAKAKEAGLLEERGSGSAHFLRQGCEEMLEGFLGRQGGRVDMTNIDADIDLEALLPCRLRFWLPFVEAVLGRGAICTMAGEEEADLPGGEETERA